MSDTGNVYLIHFARPICDDTTRSTTQHYMRAGNCGQESAKRNTARARAHG